MLHGVLDHDDRRVDHGADGDRDAAEAHDVGRQPERVHAGIRNEHAERQGDDGDERTSDVQQEHHAHERDDEAFLEQRVLQRLDRSQNEVGSVVDRQDFGTVGQAGLDLGQSLFDVGDDG